MRVLLLRRPKTGSGTAKEVVVIKRANGQHLQEIMIVIGLVAVAGIAALTFFGQTVTNGFSSTSNGTAKQAEKPKQSSSLVSTDGIVPSQGDQLGLTGPNSLDPSSYTSNLDVSIETAGANGTSEILLQQLEAKTRQLIAAGEITPEQANDIKQLANLGHQMAGVEKFLETTVQAHISDPSELKNKTFLYNNKPYTASELATELQLSDDRFDRHYPISSDTLMGQYLALQTKITDTMPQNDNRLIIGALSNQIASIANLTEDGTHGIIAGNFTSTNFAKSLSTMGIDDPSNGALPFDKKKLVLGSSITDQHSATICQSDGQGSDSGKFCE